MLFLFRGPGLIGWKYNLVPVFVLNQRSESSFRRSWLWDLILVVKFRNAAGDRKIRAVYTVSFLSFLECFRGEEWSSKFLELAAVLWCCQYFFLSRLFCQLEGKRQPARVSLRGKESSGGIYLVSDKGLRLVPLLSHSVLLVCWGEKGCCERVLNGVTDVQISGRHGHQWQTCLL